MSEYTPGPWKWVADKSGGPGEIHAGKTLVAHFPWGNCNELADARLIAAAPELLAALTDAENRLAGAGMLGADDRVSRAITKATK